jgi:pyruvoyl-dependent arginine decarboxylase (PvlArgDC)
VFPYVAEAGASGAGAGGGGGFGGGGGGLFAVPNLPGFEKPASIRGDQPSTLHQGSGASGAPAANLRTSMDSLIETITTTIDPEGWADVGGKSSISPVGSSLLISTTPETHAKLTALIDIFRQRWGSLRTISVQAHWLWLTPQQVDEALTQAKAGDGNISQVSLNSVSPDNWKKLLAIGGEKGAPNGYHAIVTCYNGQTVAAQAGTQRLVVTGINPVVGSGEKTAIGYAPMTRSIHEGATLQITPLATRHVKYVVLDVHSRVNLLPAALQRLEEKVEKVVENDPKRVVEAMDRTVLQSQRLETTLRLPVGQPTLIGGMTFAGAEGKNGNLYLFITAKVQELRDDEPAVTTPTTPEKPAADSKPALNSKPITP